LFFHKIHTPKI